MKEHRFEALDGGFRWVEVEVPNKPDKSSETDQAVEDLALREHLLRLGAPKRHSFSTPTPHGEWGQRRDQIAGMLKTGFTVALIGGRGNGKTQMGVSLMIHSMKDGRSCRYTTAVGFFMEIRACFRREAGQSELQVIQKYLEPSFLVIDELGKRTDSVWEHSSLFELLNKRYAAMSDTLLIANMTAPDFTAALGPSLSSRMAEDGGIIECNWGSFR